jgi:YegS/Rv2252/BmrU family lipid kinase
MAEQSAPGPKWLVIVNPNAGNRKGVREWKMISSRLSEKGILYTVKFTTGKGDATSYAREAIGAGYRHLITVGGDGTLNEVLNGIMTNRNCSPGDVTMGLIPVGTGNDWGRMLGIPLDHEKAIDIIAEGNVMKHDAGHVRYHNGRDSAERYFINIAGLGFESVVVRRTNHQKDRGRGGKLIYFYNLLMSLLSYRNTDAEITIDGISRKLRIFSLNAGNGKYCGGGMRQTPDAIPDDGLLDLTIIRDVSKFEIIKSLKLLYNGAIYSHPGIEGHRCTRLSVSSDSTLWVEADGESLGHTPAEFTIIPGAITVIYGKGIIQ